MLSMLFELHPNPSKELIFAVHIHDNAERIIGDAPSPGLRQNVALSKAYNEAQERILQSEYGVVISELPEADINWIDSLDKLEAFFFAIDQLRLGNKNALNIIKNVDQWFHVREFDDMVPREVMKIFREARQIDDLR